MMIQEKDHKFMYGSILCATGTFFFFFENIHVLVFSLRFLSKAMKFRKGYTRRESNPCRLLTFIRDLMEGKHDNHFTTGVFQPSRNSRTRDIRALSDSSPLLPFRNGMDGKDHPTLP